MADYKAITGHHIETVAGDPSVLQVGDIWYNSTLGKVRGAKLAAGSWATGGNLNAGANDMAGIGLQTAALCVAGTRPAGQHQTVCESYDGSSWTEVGDINTGRIGNSGLGTQTAALTPGGNDAAPAFLTVVESFNGTSWTEIADLNTGKCD